ncbi:MAG: flavodoxin family protein [Methanospirillaceae archaeon]|nr:flavodoxin family protein [Methanospirillaceae archaeon]
MNISIIFYSYTGVTRRIAEQIQEICKGSLTEVQTNEYPSRVKAYTAGIFRAMRGICDPIKPDIIDVSFDDLLVIGTPVWAGKPTPAINAAVQALSGCEGKPAVIYATCKAGGGDTLPVLKKALTGKGIKVVGEFVFDKDEVQDPEKIAALVKAIRGSGGSS